MELHSYFRMAFLSCILGALFILTGCSQATVQPPLSTDVAEAKSFKMAIGEPITLSQKIHIPTSGQMFDLSEQGTEVEAYYGDSLVISVHDENAARYYSYTPETQQARLIGSTPVLQLGSGSSVITRNDRMFTAYAFGNEKKSVFLEMNLNKGGVRQITHFDWWPPFQYFALTEKDEVLYFSPKKDERAENEEVYSYHISRYSPTTEKTEELIHLPDSTIEGISCFDYANQKIYTYQFSAENASKHYTLCSYQPSGKLSDRYDITEVNKQIWEANDAVCDLVVFKNYFFMWSLNGRFISLQNNDGIQPVSITGESSGIQYYESKKNAPGSFGCLYSQHTNEIIRYDESRQCFVKQLLQLDKNCMVNCIFVNENGDMIVKLVLDAGEKNEEVAYYSLPLSGTH